MPSFHLLFSTLSFSGLLFISVYKFFWHLLQFLKTMSFVFRGTRGDIETGFPGLIPERRTVLWLVPSVFLMATTLRMYATCQQLQGQAQAHVVAASGLLGHTELRLHMPPSIALATRGRLQGLRPQLALPDREFDDLDYETLRALDADNVPTASMTDEEINALPADVWTSEGFSSLAQVCPGH